MILHKLTMPMDRWSARVVSPLDVSAGVDQAIHGHPVIVHPGWGKDPERHRDLLFDLADAGYCPIGVDTRYAYADRALEPSQKHYRPIVSKSNRHFEDADRNSNRWKYRRPTVTLEICQRLGIGVRSYIGHSKGGLILALAAVADPESTKSLIVVNGAGTGDSSRGVSRLMRSNANRISEFANGEDGILEATRSAASSVLYASTHLRRTLAEKHFIQTTNTWEILDRLATTDMNITVMHAQNDEMISFEDSQASAKTRPWLHFVPTNGGHSNVYETSIREIILNSL